MKGIYDLKQTVRGNNLSNDSLSLLIVLNISDQEEVFRERYTLCVWMVREAFQMWRDKRMLTAADECKTVSAVGKAVVPGHWVSRGQRSPACFRAVDEGVLLSLSHGVAECHVLMDIWHWCLLPALSFYCHLGICAHWLWTFIIYALLTCSVNISPRASGSILCISS